jgi:hypothetical protein
MKLCDFSCPGKLILLMLQRTKSLTGRDKSSKKEPTGENPDAVPV